MAVSVYKVKWDKSLSLGDKELDEQHELFFQFTNELLLNYEDKNNPEAISKVINSLIDFSVYHFSYEEEFLRKNNYPNLERHIALHNSFRDKVKEFKDDLQDGDSKVMDKIIIYLINWIKQHTYVEDLDYKNYLHS